jgi:hypothetical protein
MTEYFDRAEYLKKTVLNQEKGDEPMASAGGTGTAAKKKYEF